MILGPIRAHFFHGDGDDVAFSSAGATNAVMMRPAVNTEDSLSGTWDVRSRHGETAGLVHIVFSGADVRRF